MGRTISDEAIVLRTYNVGEADRFCILLSRSLGRISARANGVRRLTSRRGSSLLMLRRVQVTLHEGKSGYQLTDASSLDAHSGWYAHLPSFTCAQQGVELVLQLIQEQEPVADVYLLMCEFLQTCAVAPSDPLLSVFCLRLLMLMGVFPEEISGISQEAVMALKTLSKRSLYEGARSISDVQGEVGQLSQSLVGNHVGSTLKVPPLAARISPASTPI